MTVIIAVILISVISGGKMRNSARAASSLDYVVDEMYIWDGEPLPSAFEYMNSHTRDLVSQARYLLAPDTAVGTQDIAILAQLKDGTTRTENARLTIRDSVVRWEIGTEVTAGDLLGERYADAIFTESLANYATVGTYPITVIVNNLELPFTLVSEDTKSPVVTLKQNLTFYLNQKLKVEDFIESCDDVSSVAYHLSENPPTYSEGEKQIQLIATDAAGNSSTYDVVYEVSGDGLAPEIQGLEKMQTIAGIRVDYLHGVQAIDENDGEVAVETEEPADFSIRKAGTYTITYKAKDEAGNIATETAELVVLPSLDDVEELSMDDVDRMGDYLIRELEKKYDKTDRKAFAKAIFDCVQQHVGYQNSHVVQDWQYDAVTALYKGVGDCRSYYALSRLLLNCAEYENMPVEKVKNYEGDSAHYWNLIKLNGAWYHFDSTPRVNSDGFFLYTDAALDAYSDRNGKCFNRDKSLYPATPTS
ncbi:MAG: hypothetical protein MJ071_05715 [Oscillospiraceae bacterium]|nr:hypothetical protein [Oscillospiraceae bacterium]